MKKNSELLPGDYQDMGVVPTDVKDNAVAAAALEGEVPYLVALDERDLLSLNVFLVAGHRPVQVVEPRDFLREVLGLR